MKIESKAIFDLEDVGYAKNDTSSSHEDRIKIGRRSVTDS